MRTPRPTSTCEKESRLAPFHYHPPRGYLQAIPELGLPAKPGNQAEERVPIHPWYFRHGGRSGCSAKPASLRAASQAGHS
eukprot:5264481-Amphidinium_carterae.1